MSISLILFCASIVTFIGAVILVGISAIDYRKSDVFCNVAFILIVAANVTLVAEIAGVMP